MVGKSESMKIKYCGATRQLPRKIRGSQTKRFVKWYEPDKKFGLNGTLANILPLSKHRVSLKNLEPIAALHFLLIFLAYLSAVGSTGPLVHSCTSFGTASCGTTKG